MLKQIAANSLEIILNRILAMDVQASHVLQPLEGMLIRWQVQGFPGCDLDYRHGRVFVLPCDETKEATVTIHGDAYELIKLAHQHAGKISLNTPPKVRIEGDIVQLRSVEKVLARLQFDAQAAFAKYLGDSLTQVLFLVFAEIKAWLGEALENLQRQTHNYVVFEAQYLAPKECVEEYLQQVDELRDDIARLSARIQRLQREVSS